MALLARYSQHRKEKYNKVNTFNDFMCMHRQKVNSFNDFMCTHKYSFGHRQA